METSIKKKVFTKEEKERISKIYLRMQSLERDISYAKTLSHMDFGEFEETYKAAIENEDLYQRYSLLMPYLRLLHLAVFVYDLDIELMKGFIIYEKKLTLMGATLEEAEQIYKDGAPF